MVASRVLNAQHGPDSLRLHPSRPHAQCPGASSALPTLEPRDRSPWGKGTKFSQHSNIHIQLLCAKFKHTKCGFSMSSTSVILHRHHITYHSTRPASCQPEICTSTPVTLLTQATKRFSGHKHTADVSPCPDPWERFLCK